MRGEKLEWLVGWRAGGEGLVGGGEGSEKFEGLVGRGVELFGGEGFSG